MKARLKKKFREEIAPALQERFSYKNVMEIHRIEKIVVNMGVGEAIQKPQITKAKKSVANFKVRAGMPIGCRVTLRSERMYEFLDRLVNAALPRVRDFRGVSAKLSGRGDYSLGIKEQFIFPEIDFDKIDKTRGMNGTLVTTAKTDEEGRELLRLFGMPFRK